MSEMKVCSVCGSEKPLSEFYKNGHRLHARCKTCHLEAVSIRYAAKREEILAQQKAYSDANPEVMKRKRRSDYEKHRDVRVAKVAEYRALNQEKIRESRRLSYERNREKIIASVAEYTRANKEALRAAGKRYYEANKAKFLTRNAVRRAAQRIAFPAWDRELTEFCLQEAADLCALRKEATGMPWHIDHQVPLQGKSACGLHVWSNLAVVPAQFNLAKRNEVGDRWLERSWL